MGEQSKYQKRLNEYSQFIRDQEQSRKAIENLEIYTDLIKIPLTADDESKMSQWDEQGRQASR